MTLKGGGGGGGGLAHALEPSLALSSLISFKKILFELYTYIAMSSQHVGILYSMNCLN